MSKKTTKPPRPQGPGKPFLRAETLGHRSMSGQVHPHTTTNPIRRVEDLKSRRD